MTKYNIHIVKYKKPVPHCGTGYIIVLVLALVQVQVPMRV
jgi:hypothetical protein